jgi:hypothetical protein
VSNLGILLYQLAKIGVQSGVVLVWLAWWTWGANWNNIWPVLRRGGWLVVVLIMILAALAWSQMAPGEWHGLGILVLPNFWWQLCAVGLLTGLTLLCGYLQGVFAWQPAEIPLEPADTVHHGVENAHHGH